MTTGFWLGGPFAETRTEGHTSLEGSHTELEVPSGTPGEKAGGQQDIHTVKVSHLLAAPLKLGAGWGRAVVQGQRSTLSHCCPGLLLEPQGSG